MKAWLRLSAFAPTHPKIVCLKSDAERWTWVLALCDAKLRDPQGKWASRAHLYGCFPGRKRQIDALLAAGILEAQPDGSVWVHGWDEWQSMCPGDPTTADRQRRYRERHLTEVTADRNGAVTALRNGQTETETETENSMLLTEHCPKPPEAVGSDQPEEGVPPAEVRMVYEHYLRARGLGEAHYRLTARRRDKIRTRLKDFEPDALCRAIDMCLASPFHQGKNDRHEVYLDLADHILRSHEQTEKWLSKARRPNA